MILKLKCKYNEDDECIILPNNDLIDEGDEIEILEITNATE